MAMVSSDMPSYQRLKKESCFDEEDDHDIHEKIIGRYLRRVRFRRVHVKRKLKVKIPSLSRFLKRKAKLIKAACTKVYKRLKESQSHFGDLFAGNYLFMQVSPTPLKVAGTGNGKSYVKGKDYVHKFSHEYPVSKLYS